MKPIFVLSLFGVLSLTACFDDNQHAQNPVQSANVAENATQNSLSNPKSSAQNSTQNTYKLKQGNAKTICNNQAIYQAYQAKNEHRKVQVLACGSVAKVLPDDNKGSRHQGFLIKIDNYPKMSVLVAHNIDLAPKVKNIQPNTPIKIYGEYVYNEKGGVLHWTHQDPVSRHQHGWIEYDGERYW